MRYNEILVDSAVTELKDKLPSLKKHDYDTIDKLMRNISKKHRISSNALHDIFVKKYKKTPDDWIKNKLDEKESTTEDIDFHSRKNINSPAEEINKLFPRVYENIGHEIKSFYDKLGYLSKSARIPIKIGGKLCVLQAVLDINSRKIILKGFRNPKSITNIFTVGNKIKQIEFDDGTIFPEKYEFSNTDLGLDLLNTFFFNSRDALEQMITAISLIKPDACKLNTKLLSEDINAMFNDEVTNFSNWVAKKLNLSEIPKIELSMDTEEAQGNTHTGGHTPGSGKIWVYAKNRNLVDILRTVAHEMVHVRQHELGMIGPNDSYPGSPIELLADMVAGKLIKIYGKKNPKVFQ